MKLLTSFSAALRTSLLAVLVTGFGACQDKVDESDLYTFKGETVSSYLQKSPDFSKFAYLLSRVRLSDKSSTTFSDLLTTRGNYTVFAPTDEAVQLYVDSLYHTPHFDLTQVSDSVAESMVRNHLIDNGDFEAYMTTQFSEGALSRTNMAQRYIQIGYDNDETGQLVTVINARSHITLPNIEVVNGYIHGLDRVIDLSGSTLPDLIESTSNLHIFAYLLGKTGWADSMVRYIDEDYEAYHLPSGTLDPGGGAPSNVTGPSPEHRFIGYTAFVEPDSVYVNEWGIPAPEVEDGVVLNYDDILEAVTAKCREAYPDAQNPDLTSQDNAVNRFVSYHLLPERITWNRLVIHHNEIGYSWRMPDYLAIDCWEYYETMGRPRRLIKLTEGIQTAGKRVNRHATYDNGYAGTYRETSCDRQGQRLYAQNGHETTQALNGFYYVLDGILVYDDDVPNKVLNERLRFDFLSICPDLMTNGIRRIEDNTWRFIPPGYISTFSYTEDTKWRYVPYWDAGEHNYQGDEINIIGQYDFTFRLPPVPYEGTWEFRICAPEIQHFGMFQLYLGTNPNNLIPIGLPLDFRIAASNPIIGWRADGQNEDENVEIDKTMRNHGYMKNGMHDGIPNGGHTVTTPMRAAAGDYIRLRKILWNGVMKPDETYYVRVKSVLENTRTCCMLDYFEFVPKSIYNGVLPEDPW